MSPEKCPLRSGESLAQRGVPTSGTQHPCSHSAPARLIASPIAFGPPLLKEALGPGGWAGGWAGAPAGRGASSGSHAGAAL